MKSQLYVPGNNEKMLRKADLIPSQGIIFDLEDAVPPEEKSNARNLVSNLLKELPFHGKRVGIRINSLDSPESLIDLMLVRTLDRVDFVVIPKTEQRVDFIYRITAKEVEVLIETARGLNRIDEVITSEGVTMISYGVADFSSSVFGDISQYQKNDYLRTVIAVKAHAYGIEPYDRVFFDLKDAEGFRAECLIAKGLGYIGKQVIHPSQVEIANQVFSPSKQEVEWANKVIEAYEKARSMGKGAIRVDDQLVDAVHYRIAKGILART
ncbi:CoA ester lyase [Sulfolobales archaeon HS-7]|nr:CoA ester lyase [Sulfolobales archaeon HS-7]